MAADDAAKLEIERLNAEVARLRNLERHLRDERERVRHEAAAELQRLQSALKEAAAHAGGGGTKPDARARQTADAGRHLAEREAAVAAAEQQVRALQSQLDIERQRVAAERSRLVTDRDRLEAERTRLVAERRRLLKESERLAEWERNTLLRAPTATVPTSFAEGLNRLADPGSASRSPSGRSW